MENSNSCEVRLRNWRLQLAMKSSEDDDRVRFKLGYLKYTRKYGSRLREGRISRNCFQNGATRNQWRQKDQCRLRGLSNCIGVATRPLIGSLSGWSSEWRSSTDQKHE